MDDATEILTRIRYALPTVDALPIVKVVYPEIDEMVTQFRRLDSLLSSGARAPQQWKGVRTGRPRTTRPILDGITHGTRRGYNAGCGCTNCLEANRLRRNLTDEEMGS